MYPILFSFGPITIYSFGVFLLLAFLVGSFIVWKFGKETFPPEKILDATLISILTGLIGARAYFIFLHSSTFGGNILKWLHLFLYPGLSFSGGLVFGLIGLFIFCRKKHLNFSLFLDISVLGLCLSEAIGWLGCFFNGCAFGTTTNLPWGFSFIGLLARRHPVQIYASVLFFLIFLLLLRKREVFTKTPGLLALSYFLLSSPTRLLLEFFRGDRIYFKGINFGQILNLSFLLGAIIILLLCFRQRLKEEAVKKVNWLKSKLRKV